MLLCVVAPSPSFRLEEGGDADEIGLVVVVLVVVDGYRDKNASLSPSLSLVNDSETSEEDDCSLSDCVTLGVIVMVGVAEVGVASAPRS